MEVLLVVALFSVLAGFGAPIYQSFQVRNNLDIASQTFVQSARRAQSLSQASDGDTSWGVNVQSGSIVVFKGASFALRDTTYDELFEIPTTIIPDGLKEIVFNKFTGLPNTIGTTTLTSLNNEARTIVINQKGMVSEN